ncbi:hypothetical protein GHT06_013550 [Daphnia sinensis]|uniref:Uncharacterized protein n=1 Tax=Daphnia sinensis TaxID=1820382 RepID=A0AAD5PY15_9CRUS|nr:hypothetical protein GHT06_013550 [Daphnia sinensis]
MENNFSDEESISSEELNQIDPRYQDLDPDDPVYIAPKKKQEKQAFAEKQAIQSSRRS